MLRAVTFDLWSTLITEAQPGLRRTRTERIRRIDEILRTTQIVSSIEAVDRAYTVVGERLEALWKLHLDTGARGQVEMLLDALPGGNSLIRSELLLDRLIEAYTYPILSDLPIPIDGAADVLATLEARDLRLAVICNTGRTPGKVLRIILERLNLAKHLAVQTYSDEVGLRKPRREIFEHTLAALGVDPQEALHVGDTLASDIAGASAIGMRAVHLCHARGADSIPADGETITSLPELVSLINGA